MEKRKYEMNVSFLRLHNIVLNKCCCMKTWRHPNPISLKLEVGFDETTRYRTDSKRSACSFLLSIFLSRILFCCFKKKTRFGHFPLAIILISCPPFRFPTAVFHHETNVIEPTIDSCSIRFRPTQRKEKPKKKIIIIKKWQNGADFSRVSPTRNDIEKRYPLRSNFGQWCNDPSLPWKRAISGAYGRGRSGGGGASQ